MTSNKDLDSVYLFKQVSLLSTSDVRYDGILYIIDYDANTLALQHVRCMGTEGRRSGEQAIAPSHSTYEFIIFRADNIKKVYVVDDNRYADITGEILEPLRSKPSYNQTNTYTGHSQNYSPNYSSPPLPSGSGPRSSRNGVGNHVEEEDEEIPMGYPPMMGNSHGPRKMQGEQMPLEDDMYVSPHMGYRHNEEQGPKRKVGVQGAKYGNPAASGDRIETGRRNYGYNTNPEPRLSNYEQQPREFRSPMGQRSNVHVDYRNDNRYDYRAQNNAYFYDNYPPRRPQTMGRGPPGGMRRDYYDSQAQGRPPRNYNPNYPPPRAPPSQQYGNYRAPMQPRAAPRQQGGNVRAGTGEFLEHRKLAGNEIEIPKEDLPLEKLSLNVENENEEKKEAKETDQTKVNPEKDQTTTETTEKTENKDATTTNEKQEESSKANTTQAQDTITLTHGKVAYEKFNFFDDLNLDSNKERGDERTKNKRPVATYVKVSSEDQEDQRHLDAETFGSVAEQYRFASGMRRTGGAPRYNRGGQNTGNYYQNTGQSGQPRYGNRPNYNNRYYERQPQFQRSAWQPRQ